MTRPKTYSDVEDMFVKVPCRICGLGFHLAGFVPGSVICTTCDRLPNGRHRRHYHKRKHPRRALRHVIEGRWT